MANLLGMAQSGAWLMYSVQQAQTYKEVFRYWYEKDGELGIVNDTADAAAQARWLFDRLPELAEDIDAYDLYQEYAVHLLDTMSPEYRTPNADLALFRTLAGLWEEDPFVEWAVEGESLVFPSAWAAAPCFKRGETLVCRALPDPATHTGPRALIQVKWVSGGLDPWMIGALQYASEYKRCGRIWRAVEGVTHDVAELYPREIPGTGDPSPIVLLRAGKPYDGLKPEGMMAYLADDVWEAL